MSGYHGIYRWAWMENRIYRRMFLVVAFLPAMVFLAVWGAIDRVREGAKELIGAWR